MSLAARAGFVARSLALVARDPAYGWDRVRNRLELSLARQRAVPGLYSPDDDVLARMHELLGAPWPCAEDEPFAAEWGRLEAELGGSGVPAGRAWDAHPALARAAWCAVRHSAPRVVVETGVARGVLSRFLLVALGRNGGEGRLWSIDLPPLAEGWQGQSKAAVPPGLHGRWTYVRGSSRRRLPALLDRLGEIDLFVHDSLHTSRNMRFELELAWERLREGGLLLVDDIESNAVFSELTSRVGCPFVVAKTGRRGALCGLARKARS